MFLDISYINWWDKKLPFRGVNRNKKKLGLYFIVLLKVQFG